MFNQTFSLDNNSGPYLLSRTLHPKDFIIGAVSLVGTFILFGVAQSHEPRLARLKCQYPSLVPECCCAWSGCTDCTCPRFHSCISLGSDNASGR